MSVSNNRHGHSHDEYITGLRNMVQTRSVAGASNTTLAGDAAPIQFITPAAAANIRLPAAANVKEGKTFFISNVAGVGALTIQDSAGGALVPAASVASGAGGGFVFTNGVWKKFI